MLYRILTSNSMSLTQSIKYILVILFSVLLSLSIHEAGHGLAAYLMGDKTAKSSGRLSLNPFAHLDIFGTLCLLLFGFGWARPVPVNPWNFKRKRLGMAITSLAGPLANFILAFIATFLYCFIGKISLSSGTISYRIAYAIFITCECLITTNIGLGLFNLIPIPPLDGSKILGSFLPESAYFKLLKYERYGFIVLIILINIPIFSRFLSFISTSILSGFINLASYVF